MRYLWEWLRDRFPFVWITLGEGYCRRLVLFKHPDGRAVYLHKFVGDDPAVHAHDHPRNFWSIGLWGSYLEQVWEHDPHHGFRVRYRRWKAPWFRGFDRRHTHRLLLSSWDTPCWTLVITGRGPISGAAKSAWGFWVSPDRRLDWEEYDRHQEDDGR